MATKRFGNIIPSMLVMLVVVSCLPLQVPGKGLLQYIGNGNLPVAIAIASISGSVMMLPGFIVFPVCGILARQGAPYMVLSAFSTSMMMVGVVTYPVEKAYLGHRIAILRNVVSFGISLAVAIITGIVFGEIG